LPLLLYVIEPLHYITIMMDIGFHYIIIEADAIID